MGQVKVKIRSVVTVGKVYQSFLFFPDLPVVIFWPAGDLNSIFNVQGKCLQAADFKAYSF